MIVDVAHLDAGAYTLGEAPEASFKLAGATLPDRAATTLVERVGQGFVLSIPATFECWIEHRGHALSQREHVDLCEGDSATLRRGDVRFDVALVERELPIHARAPLDRAFWASVIGHAILFIVMLLLIRATPPDSTAESLEHEAAAARFAARVRLPVPAVPKAVDERQGGKRSVGLVTERTNRDGGERGKAAKGRSGRSAPDSRRTALRQPIDVPALDRRIDPIAAARTAGILGLLPARGWAPVDAGSGTAFNPSSSDALLWAGTRELPTAGAGLGLRGEGRGGGGSASGLAGFGSVDLLGHGGGVHGPGSGNATNFEEREGRIPDGILCKITVTGSMDRDVIRRIVRTHINEIRSCYNAGLTRNPGLEGQVTLQFSILATGKVGAAIVESSTIPDTEVGACIVRAAKRWSFPPIPNKSTALVSYPFRLQSR
jgi:TonB family protein